MIKDTVLKEVRSKTLIFIFLATTVAMILSHLVLSTIYNQSVIEGGAASLSLAGADLLSINFRILNVISFTIATIFGISVFRSDFQNNIIYQYLTLPISRTEYFFTRVIGTWVLVLSYYLYAYILSTVLYSIAFKSNVLKGGHLVGFMILCVYLLVVIFLSSLFSLFMNKIAALFVTFITTMISTAAFKTFSELPIQDFLTSLGFFKIFGLIFYYLYPRLSFLDELAAYFISAQSTSVLNMWEQSIHFVLIVSIYVYIANYLLKKKDF